MACTVQCVPVRSSWVAQFILTANCELAVWFKNGVCCLYPGTTAAWFNRAIAAPSPGRYIWQYLYKKMAYKLIRAPCPGGGGLQTSCCSNPFPATLHATISDRGNAACAATTIALPYDAAAQKWTGTGPLGSCGHDITLSFYCGLRNLLYLDVHWPDGCGLDQGGATPSAQVCNPLTASYQIAIPFPCGGSPPSAQANVLVTA
jgi:hypothetical protein